MEPDPLNSPPGAKKTNSKPKPDEDMDSNRKSKTSSNGLNLVVCVLCLVCASSSVYNGWRESGLEGRLHFLEDRVAELERKSVDEADVLVERFRREAVEHMRRRSVRDLAAEKQIEDVVRTTREAPECICPAGKSFVLLWLAAVDAFLELAYFQIE